MKPCKNETNRLYKKQFSSLSRFHHIQMNQVFCLYMHFIKAQCQLLDYTPHQQVDAIKAKVYACCIPSSFDTVFSPGIVQKTMISTPNQVVDIIRSLPMPVVCPLLLYSTRLLAQYHDQQYQPLILVKVAKVLVYRKEANVQFTKYN